MKKVICRLYHSGIRHYISGMAPGVDTWAAELVLELREVYLDVELEAAVPCIDQPKHWTQPVQSRYYNIISLCDTVTVMRDSNGKEINRYFDGCMAVRNYYMVDHADIVFGVWGRRTQGGTYQTLQYADKRCLPILILNPNNLRLTIRNKERLHASGIVYAKPQTDSYDLSK